MNRDTPYEPVLSRSCLRRERGALVISIGALLLLPSCGTLCAVALESDVYRTPLIFPGVRFDTSNFADQFASPDTQAGRNAGGCVSRGSTVMFTIIDLPFSIVGDTVPMLGHGIYLGVSAIAGPRRPPTTPTTPPSTDVEPRKDGSIDEGK